MKNTIVAALVASSIALAGCSAGETTVEDVKVELETVEQPITTGEFTTYTVNVKDGDKAIAADKVEIEVNMEMMNHPMVGEMKEVKTGVYEIDLPLAMAGDWYALIDVTLGEETKEFKESGIKAEGEKVMEYMKGYDADNPEAHKSMDHGDSMDHDHGDSMDHDHGDSMDHDHEDSKESNEEK